MSFVRPELLWLALIGVPVVILYMIRQRKIRRRIPSLFLWEQVLKRVPRRQALGAITSLLSLLLTLLAIGAGTISAADPRTGRNAPVPRQVEPPSKGRIIAILQVGGLHHRYTRAA